MKRGQYTLVGGDETMTTQQGLATHETLEMHELLAFKNVCLTKSQTMQALVKDE
jgi:hypothetical protein